MGLFGNLMGKFNNINPDTHLSFADRLSAAGGALQGVTNGRAGLDQLANSRLLQEQLEGARKSLFGSIDQAYAPQYPQAASIDPSMVGSPDQPAPQERPDPMSILMPALLKASAQGLDIGDQAGLLKQAGPNYEAINGGDGTYGVFDRKSGHVTPGQLPNQYGDMEIQKRQAQIDALIAQAQQRRAAGAYSTAKAKNPYAPRQPRAGPKALPPLPTGFVVSQ